MIKFNLTCSDTYGLCIFDVGEKCRALQKENKQTSITLCTNGFSRNEWYASTSKKTLCGYSYHYLNKVPSGEMFLSEIARICHKVETKKTDSLSRPTSVDSYRGSINHTAVAKFLWKRTARISISQYCNCSPSSA